MLKLVRLLVAGVCLALAGSAQSKPFDGDCGHGQGLGVSRVEVIDTTGGPRFGLQFQDSGTSFLAPGEVVLTFDDGPFAPSTKPILDTLDRFCAKATFFAVGRMALAQPQTLREIARKGHTIAGHTWAHAYLGRLDEDKRIAEVEKGFSALTEVVGNQVAPFFRFPYLSAPESELERLAQRNVAVFGIDVDSTDSHGQHVSAKRIVERTLAGLEKTGRGIILLHDLKENTAAALPDLLAALKEKKYRLVHIVPKSNFEPNAAFTAEVAELMAKRQQKADGAQGKQLAAVRVEDTAGTLRPQRHLRKAKASATTSSSKQKGRKGKGRRGTAEQDAPKNGPFRRI